MSRFRIKHKRGDWGITLPTYRYVFPCDLHLHIYAVNECIPSSSYVPLSVVSSREAYWVKVYDIRVDSIHLSDDPERDGLFSVTGATVTWEYLIDNGMGDAPSRLVETQNFPAMGVYRAE